MTTGKAILGMMAGIAAGAIVGMLVSPRRTNRRADDIARQSEDLANAIDAQIDRKFEQVLKTLSTKVKAAEEEEVLLSRKAK